MKFSSSFSTTALFVSLVSAVPVNKRAVSGNSGAAYFMTNEPSGNTLISTAINADGTLTFGKAYSTGGRGVHGLSDPIGPDGLFSQNSVTVSSGANMLGVVNPGANTVALFSINAKQPELLTMIGQPVSSGGEFPMSMAINSDGSQVCVLNGGKVNGVQCYTVDDDLGLVAQEGSFRSLNLNQTTPANGPANTASQLIYSEDGQQLIASVKGDPGPPAAPGFLAVWNIDGSNNLSEDFQTVKPGNGGLLPFSMTLINGQNAILATDAGVGFDIFDMSGQNRSSVVPIQGQGATCWSSFSPKTGNFYLTDILTDQVTEVNVDNNLKGTIVKQYPQTPGSGTIDNSIASLKNNDFLYILQPNTTTVSVLALTAPGQAKNVQSFDIQAPATQFGVEINHNNLQGMTTYVSQQ